MKLRVLRWCIRMIRKMQSWKNRSWPKIFGDTWEHILNGNYLFDRLVQIRNVGFDHINKTAVGWFLLFLDFNPFKSWTGVLDGIGFSSVKTQLVPKMKEDLERWVGKWIQMINLKPKRSWWNSELKDAFLKLNNRKKLRIATQDKLECPRDRFRVNRKSERPKNAKSQKLDASSDWWETTGTPNLARIFEAKRRPGDDEEVEWAMREQKRREGERGTN